MPSSSHTPPSERRIITGTVLVGAAAGLTLALVESGLLFAPWSRVTVDRGRLALVATLVLLAVGVALGALEGLLVRGVEAAAAAKGPPRTLRRRMAALYALGAAPVAAWGCFTLFGGRYAQTLPFQHLLAAACAALLVGATFGAARIALGVGDRLRRGTLSPWRARALGAALLGTGLLLYLVDRNVLPRLYPFLHWALLGAAAVALQLGVGALALAARAHGAARRRLARPGLALGLAALSLAGGGVALELLARSERLRFNAFEHMAATRKALALAGAARLSSRADAHPVAAQGRRRPWQATRLPAGPRLTGRDLVLVTIDAVRADHVGAYGYGRPTTPVIDALARDGVVFERAYVPTPSTTYSLSTLMTGQPVFSLAARGAAPPRETVPLAFRRAGYRTAGFFPPAVFFSDAHKLGALEQRRFDFEYARYEYSDAATRTDQVIRYFESERPARAFVWVHYFEPHEPYERHPGISFGDTALDRYDGEIAYVDRHLGRLVEWLRQRRPEAIIVVAADHGEEFGDHGGNSHGSSLYDEQARVPLVVNAPGLPRRRVTRPVATLDLPRTALTLLGLRPPAWVRGEDLTPWLAATPAPPAVGPPVFSELEHKKMVAVGDHKLICDLRYEFCELYDLSADPHERRNLVDSEAAVASSLRGELAEWLARSLSPEPERGGWRDGLAPRPAATVDAGAPDAAVGVAGLARVLAGPHPGPRREAARLLRGMRSPSARAALRPYVHDGDPEVARAAIAAAAPLSPDAKRLAAELLEQPSVPDEERLWAAVGLAEAGDGAGAPVLAAAVVDACRIVADGSAADGRCAGAADMELARHAVRLLGRLGDPGAVDDLLAARANVRLRRDIVETLGLIGDERVADVLAAELSDEVQTDVRVAIGRALQRLGDRRVALQVAQAFARETELSAARELFRALGDLGGAAAGGAETADLGSGRLPRDLVLHPPPGPPPAGLDLWLLAAPGARGRLQVGFGAGPATLVDLDGRERVARVTVPRGAAGTPVRVSLVAIDGDPRIGLVWLRALRPGAVLPPAPASQWVPAPQQAPAPGAAIDAGQESPR